jgi:hypothetical protein
MQKISTTLSELADDVSVAMDEFDVAYSDANGFGAAQGLLDQAQVYIRQAGSVVKQIEEKQVK